MPVREELPEPIGKRAWLERVRETLRSTLVDSSRDEPQESDE